MPFSTGDSHFVPNSSTKPAQRCLNSQFWWDAVCSSWYDRKTIYSGCVLLLHIFIKHQNSVFDVIFYDFHKNFIKNLRFFYDFHKNHKILAKMSKKDEFLTKFEIIVPAIPESRKGRGDAYSVQGRAYSVFANNCPGLLNNCPPRPSPGARGLPKKEEY